MSIPISNETLEKLKEQAKKAPFLPIVNIDGVTHTFSKATMAVSSDLVIRLCDEITRERVENVILRAKNIGLKAQRK